MTKEIKEIQPLDLTPLVDDPTLITVKAIKAKIVDQVPSYSAIPAHDPRYPNVKIVGRIGSHTILFRMFKDDPTNQYLGKVSYIDYIIQLTGQILAATKTDAPADRSAAESARVQASEYIAHKIPELFTT